MMRIAQCKIDDKGRITIPKSFLKANHIKIWEILGAAFKINSLLTKKQHKKSGQGGL